MKALFFLAVGLADTYVAVQMFFTPGAAWKLAGAFVLLCAYVAYAVVLKEAERILEMAK